MDSSKRIWLWLKGLMILGAAVLAPTINLPAESPDYSSYWVASIVPVLFFPWAIWLFHRGSKNARQYQSSLAIWMANPFTLPSCGSLPFYHLAGWCGVAGGLVGLAHGLMNLRLVDMSTSLFSLSSGTGILIGTVLTLRTVRNTGR